MGEYRLLARIGEGGMGVVHLAQKPGGRRVALKVLRPHVVGDDEARARLAREVNSLSRIKSPKIAEIVDADPWADIPYVATRYVPGLSLHDHVRQEGPVDERDLSHFASELCAALMAVHRVGVLHRDIKPSNVLMEGRNPILIDFGLARVADDPRLTHTGWLLGTPGYLAPEILHGEDASPAADVHALASTIAYAGLGRAPFGRGPAMAVMDRVRRGEHDLDGLPTELRAALEAALDPEPARRPTLDTLRAWIDPASAGDSTRTRPAPLGVTGAIPSTMPVTSSPPASALAGGALAGGAAAAAGGAAARDLGDDDGWDGWDGYPADTRVDPEARTVVDGPALSPQAAATKHLADDAPTLLDTPVVAPTPAPTPTPTPAPERSPRTAADLHPPAQRAPYQQPPAPPPGAWQPSQERPAPTPYAGPVPLRDQQRPDPRARPAVPPEGYGEPPAPRRTVGERLRASLLVLALGALLTASTVVAPWLTLMGVGVAVWLVRAVSLSGTARRERRAVRGAHWSDGPRSLLGAPWHLVVSVLGSSMLVLWALILALSAALVALALGAPTAGCLAVGGAVLAVGVWTGPGGSRVRGPVRAVVRPLSRAVPAWVLSWVLVVAAGAAVAAVAIESGTSWAPAGDAPSRPASPERIASDFVDSLLPGR